MQSARGFGLYFSVSKLISPVATEMFQASSAPQRSPVLTEVSGRLECEEQVASCYSSGDAAIYA